MRSCRQHRVAGAHTDIRVHTTHTHTDTCTGTYMVGHFKHIPQHAQHCRKMPLCISVKRASVSKWATDKLTHKWRAISLHPDFKNQNTSPSEGLDKQIFNRSKETASDMYLRLSEMEIF